ncbi:MAG TPA: helix-turn-helix transcriptional regulator [Actinomycetota bacterium]|nr:helix-turn-helix transcriptional regulator [Actinomycetota bacterium]
MADRHRPTDPDRATFVISIAAELAGVHPQTLRVYERKGLVQPQRTEGNMRRYSQNDIERLRRIQELTQEGLNLAGVMRVIELERELARMGRLYERALADVAVIQDQIQELMTARDHNAMVPLRDMRRIRRAMKADIVDQAGRRRTWPAPPVGGPTE